MSLFKERQASARKVIELQNEIISLKSKLTDLSSNKECQNECSKLKDEIKLILSQKDESILDIKENHSNEIATLKASIKKLKSEIRKLKNKSSKEEPDV